MRNFTFLFFVLFFYTQTNAQVATNYGFTQVAGTFTPITGGLSLGNETTDDQRFVDPAVPLGGTLTTGVGLPIGFDFTYNGQVYNRLAINANGWISFGNSALSPAVNINSLSAYTALSATSTATPTHLRNRVAPFALDLQAQAGASIRLQTIGDAPNRVCVVQWLNYRRFGAANSNMSLNFQIRLHETTNVVDFVYGTMTFNASTFTAQVGLSGVTNADFNNRQTTTNWNTTVQGTANTSGCVFSTSVTPPVVGTTFSWTLQSCISPALQATTNLTSNSATVSWSLSTSNPTDDYEWELRTSGLPGSGSTGLVQSGTIASTETQADFTGLASQTNHQFYIRSNCGGSFSAWTSTSFTTLCSAFVPPTLENFNSFTTSSSPIPNCWFRADNGTPATGPTGGNANNYWWGNNWLNTAGTANASSARFNIYTTNRQGWLISPTFDLSAGGYSVFFDVAATNYNSASAISGNGGNMGPDDELRFMMSTDNGATWQTVELYNEANTPPVNGTTAVFDISSVNSANVIFAFYASSGTTNTPNTDYDVFVDNFSVASCLPPTNLNISALTNGSVNLNWTLSTSNPADGYQWEVRTEGQAGSGPVGLVDSGSLAAGISTVSVSGLTSATTYQFYVKSICSSTDQSVWLQGPNFTTFCDDVTEFSENFESTTAGATALPPCWNRGGSSSTVNVVTASVAPMSPPNRLQMSANASPASIAYAILPPVSNLADGTHRLRFKAYATSASRSLDIGYFTDASDVNTFVLLESKPMPSTEANTAEEFFVEIVGVSLGAKRLGFRNQPSGTGTALIFIDDVQYEAIPDCPNPTAVTANNITNVSADLSWTDNAFTFEADIKWGLQGFDFDTEGTLISSTFDNPYALTGLVGNTNYSFYVRSVCDASSNNYSPWEGPFNFTTLCDPYNVPYFEGFESGYTHNTTVAGCLTQQSIVGVGTWLANNTLTTSNRTPRTGSWNSFLANSNDDWLFIPVNLVANTNYTLEFYARQNTTTPANANISAAFGTQGNAGSMINVIIPQTNVANGNYQQFLGTFVVPADGVYFLGIKGNLTTTFNFLSIDDISLNVSPSCQFPLGLVASNATTDSVLLTWNTNLDHESWEIEYGPVGFTQGTGTLVPASTNPFTLTGLAPQTTYQVYVRALCDNGNETSTWSNPISFTTACVTETVLPYSQNFNSTAVGQVPLCWNRVLVSGTNIWQVGTTANNFEITSNNDGNFVHKVWNDSEALLISNAVDLSTYTGDDLRLVFKNHRRSPAHPSDKVNWYVNSTPDLTGATLLQSFPSLLTESSPATAYATAVEPVTLNGWYTYIMNFDSTIQTGSQLYFIAQGVTNGGGSSYGIALDDFVVELVPATPPGCATNVQGTQDNACGNFPITVTWDVVSGADGYKITAGTTSGGSDLANNQDLGSVTSFLFNTPTINTTYYLTITPYNAVGDAVGCAEETFTTVATGCYCVSVPSTVDGQGITNVVLGATSFPNTTASYTYHQTPVVGLQQGVNANVQITFATGFTYDTNIWIDFNDDFNFTPDELVFQGESLVTNPTTLDASFLMPAGAALGQHRMRIGTADFGQFTPNPCYSGSWGVTLDFEVNILAAPSCLPPTALVVQSISATSATFAWTASPNETNGYQWLLMNAGDDPLVDTPVGSGSLPTGTVSATVPGLITGNSYDFYIRTNCDAGEQSVWVSVTASLNYCVPNSTSSFDYITAFSTSNAAGQNLNISQTEISAGGYGNYTALPISHFAGGSFDFSYTFTDGNYGFRIWVDWNNNLTFEASESLFYYTGDGLTQSGSILIPEGTADGEYIIRCRGEWGTDADPSPCGTISWGEALDMKLIVDSTLSTSKFGQLSLSLFPNPVRDVLNVVNSEVLENITIVNLLGQQVKNLKVNATQAEINVSTLPRGAYLLKATSVEGKEGVIKFIKH